MRKARCVLNRTHWLAAIGLCAFCVSVRAQEPSRQALLQRLATYAARFVADFANVVAVESYEQLNAATGQRPLRIESDFLLVRYPGRETQVLQFRDVKIVNERAVGDVRQLERLFVEPFDDAVKRAKDIANASARFISPVYTPLMALVCVQASDQQYYVFTEGGVEERSGQKVRMYEFLEGPGGRLGPAHGNMLISGKIWFEETTGRVVRTELRIGVTPTRTDIATVFGHDGKLEIDVPVEMRVTDASGQPTAVMKYGNFRRFHVRTDESFGDAPSQQ